MKKQVYSIRLSPDIRKIAGEVAASEGRTFTNWVEWMILRRLSAKKQPGENCKNQ